MRIKGKKFELGDSILVNGDNGEFMATIKQFNTDTDGTKYVTVEDQNGDCFDVAPEKIEKD